MAPFSIPCDINFINEILLAYTRYDNNYNLGNVQPMHKGGLEQEITNLDDVDGQNVIEVHLENLWKQKMVWNPHYHNSGTWAFFKVNDNQPKDLFQNQTMKCIICHSDITPLEIVAMCKRCKKGLIVYHKFSGTTAMKKHVEFNHFSLLKNLLKDTSNLASRCPLDREPNKKMHMYLLL